MIEIEQSGSLNTIQDLGRPAWRHLGVSVSGVMDPLALRAGNALLGNEENAAAIEVQMFPFRVRFPGGHLDRAHRRRLPGKARRR